MATAVLRGGHAFAEMLPCPPRSTGMGLAPKLCQLEQLIGPVSPPPPQGRQHRHYNVRFPIRELFYAELPERFARIFAAAE